MLLLPEPLHWTQLERWCGGMAGAEGAMCVLLTRCRIEGIWKEDIHHTMKGTMMGKEWIERYCT